MPPKGRKQVLQLLHEGHPGISRMKGTARSVVWWPGLSQNIEEAVKDCTQCQQHQKAPAPASLHPWEWPDGPWSRLHIEHAGPFLGKYFMVMHTLSKWRLSHLQPHHTRSGSWAVYLQHMDCPKLWSPITAHASPVPSSLHS